MNQVHAWDLEPTPENIAALGQVVKDLETVHDPLTSNVQRLQAQSRLDQVRDNTASWRLAIALASQRNAFPHPVRHFGISVLESGIKYFWLTFNEDETIAIRHGLLHLCGELDGTTSPPTYLIAKLALLFVALLKRTWLASWDDPLPILIELYNRSADSRVLVLQIFRYIVEDCFLSPEEPLPQKRKRLLVQMLTVACASERVLQQVYPEGVDWLDTLPGWTKWGIPGQVGLMGLVASTVMERTTEILASNSPPDQKVVRELLAAIKFLQVCVPWGTQQSLVEINLLGLLHQTLLIKNNELRTLVLDTLYVLMNRTAVPAHDRELITMRREAFSEHSLQGYGQVLDQVLAGMLTTTNGQIDVDREGYGVGKKFVMYICALASSELIPSHCEPVATLPSFLYLLLRFSTTPSLWISIQTCTIWRNLLVIRTADRLHLPAEQLGNLLSLCIDRLVDYEDLLDAPEWSSYALFLREDFDEFEGGGGLFKNFLSGVKRVLMEIVEGVVIRECSAAMKFMGERLARFIEVDRLDKRGLDERGFCRKTAPAYVQACCVLRGITATNVGIGIYLDNFVGTEEQKISIRDAIATEVKRWGKMIANADISDPRIFGRQISAYSALWKYMKNEPEMISMISKALNGLDLPYPPDAPRGVKRTYKAVRARAGQSLIYFSTHCPDAIMGGFEELWEHYSRGIEEVDMPQRSALVLLTVLFIVNDRANNAGMLQERTGRFDRIVGKLVERWNFGLAQVPGGLDLAGFIKLIGADRVGEYIRIIPKVRTDIERHGVNAQQYDSTVLDDEGLTLKRTLKQLHRWSWPLRELSSLIDTQQRHSNAKSRGEWQTHQISQINRWSTHIHTFIPGLFRIIACLQGFCNPLNAGGMPFGIQDIGAMVDMGGWDEAAGNTSSDEGSNEKTIRTLVKRLQKNVRNARDHAYVPCDLVNDRFGVLGSLSRLGNVFYAIPDIANLLLESLFGEIQGMGILSWRNLVDDAIRPLVINCPHEYWPTFLPALIPPLLMWLVEHTEWDALNQIESGKIANGDGTVQDEETEVSKEAVLRFLFEGLVGLCTDLVSPMTRGDTAIVVNSKEMAFAARESEMRNVALRKKIQLRAFVLERSDIMEAYLMLTSKLLKIHDTRAVQHTVRNIQSILRTLMPSQHYQRFVANTILEAALLSYNDSYFAETQSELLDLISQIYTADTSGEAKSLFLRLPGVKESSLATYDQGLEEHKSSRSKRQLTKELLAEIKGLATSEQGRKQVDLGPDTSARSMMQKLAAEAAAKAKRDKGDLLSRDERDSMHAEEGDVLHLLFGQNGQ